MRPHCGGTLESLDSPLNFPKPYTMFSRLGWSVILYVCVVSATFASIPSHTYGPIWRDEKDARHDQLDLLGPLVTYKDEPDAKKHEFALRPLLYHVEDRDMDAEEWDGLYPFITYDRFGKESRFQIFQLFAFSTSEKEKGVDDKFTLFPFIFIDNAAQPEKGYRAFFPVYGEIKHRLTFDKLSFVMFPIYVDGRKKDVRTHYVLFPIFSWSDGKDLDGFRFFPLFGWLTKKDAYDKRYILFPFWISQDQTWDPENIKHGRASLPFFYHEWTPTRDARTVLWPFFRRVEDRKREYVEWDFPWPLWVIARGKDYNITRFLPFYGKSEDRDRRGYAFLFPLWKWNIAGQPDGKVETSRFLFYLMADTVKTRDSTGQSLRRVESLPLFQYKRDYDGSINFQTLALLEAILPGQKSIVRNYSPLWTIFQYRREANGDAMNSVLWNLWRWEKQGDKREMSAALGLFQLRKDGDQRALRLFFLPAIRWNDK